MITQTKTTIYRDNHNDDNKRKSGKVTIASIIAVVGLLAAKIFFPRFWPW